MSLRIAINGFGRIGRAFLRSLLLHQEALKKINVVTINTGPHHSDNLDILFKYDSIMKEFKGTVEIYNNSLIINGHSITLLAHKDPRDCAWKNFNIDWVVDASGCFTDGLVAQAHLDAGAKKVLITAPASNEDVTIIPGVNDTAYDMKKHAIVSLGSCTTNAFAPLVKVLHEAFGIEQGLMTTTHAYTNDQVLLDVEHKDPRRARAAGLNIVPTKTGADKVITKIFPALDGKIRASSIRVPVPVVSLIDFTFNSKQKLESSVINNAFRTTAQKLPYSIIHYSEKPLVSSDFIGNEASCIFDSLLTQTTNTLCKVFAWYDNEYGYSCRLRDFLLHNS